MKRLRIVLAEPDDVEGLYPFSLTHGAWDIRVGYYTLQQRWANALPECDVTVQTSRQHIQALYTNLDGVGTVYAPGPQLLVTATFIAAPVVMRRIVAACEGSSTPLHFTVGAKTAAVFIPEGGSTLEEIIASVDAVDGSDVSTIHVAGHIVTRLWQTLDLLSDAVAWDSELLGSTRIDATAKVNAMSIIDETAGPVILGPDVVVSPFAVLTGPCSIGAGSLVKPHAHITNCAIGPQCRVSGEIANSVFQGYGNKQHEGFVGHSYFGEWVNLGAGTTTSNLKTTYSHVRVTMPWGREDSHRMFLGTMMGDFSRTAIGTLLSTGTVVGSTVVLFAGATVKACTRSFMWGQERYEMDQALSTAEVVMGRRNMQLPPALRAVLRSVHDDDR